MSEIVFIADFFADEIPGGGELNNDELAELLKQKGSNVAKIKSINVTPNYLQELGTDTRFIISNFIQLSEESKKVLQNDKAYIIYEHDHKYVKTRNPANYKNFIAPKEEIINFDFYKSAKSILCQTDFHSNIVRSNLHLDNIKSLNGNLWSMPSIKLMARICDLKKAPKYSIMNSDNWHKNTQGAIKLCNSKQWNYELINPSPYAEFVSKLGKNDKFIFLPKTPETLSRIVVESRMMGMSVITNKLVGAINEKWFCHKGQDLINTVIKMRDTIPELVTQSF